MASALEDSKPDPRRWLPTTMIGLSAMLSYLDRLLLSAAAPAVMMEFGLNNEQYGQVAAIFSIPYALAAPFAGLFIDLLGLRVGVSIVVAIWSLAAASTGLAKTIGMLLTFRVLLGIAESGGVPATGKTYATYLPPGDLAMGTAATQLGNSLGGILAPIVFAALAPVYGWRSTFIVCGIVGLVWVPAWLAILKAVPARREVVASKHEPIGALFKDARFYGIAIANMFIMALYSLWTNWTTLYFVNVHHMTAIDANKRFAWLPPTFAVLGGVIGASLMMFWIRRGTPVRVARLRIAWSSAFVLLSTAALPFTTTPEQAAALISISYLFTTALSTTAYAAPIDLFGHGRAAFSVAALTLSYGLMQTILSPLVGRTVDHVGFSPVFTTLAFAPLIGAAIMHLARRKS